MDRTEAHELLSSEDWHSRLRAARFFSRYALPSDQESITKTLATENVSLVRTVLSKALANLTNPHDESVINPSEDVTDLTVVDEIYSRAMRETASMLLHEIRPILGPLIRHAKQEIAEYDNSRTSRQLNRLDSLLTAFEALAKAATPPTWAEFELAELIEEILEAQLPEHSTIAVEPVGSNPLIVVSDRALVELVISNGLRNAIEATEMSTGRQRLPKIIINWGETDLDYWIFIIDRGPGLPVGSNQVWEIGNTNKRDHLGMGLAIADQAAQSLKGKVSLNPRTEGGVAFEFRWPKAKDDYASSDS